jgi:hypothetical protein
MQLFNYEEGRLNTTESDKFWPDHFPTLSASDDTYVVFEVICFFPWASSDGKTHSQIDRVLIDKRRHSKILDVGYFREAVYDT